MKKLWHVRRHIIEHFKVAAETREEAKENFPSYYPFAVTITKETAEVFSNKPTGGNTK